MYHSSPTFQSVISIFVMVCLLSALACDGTSIPNSSNAVEKNAEPASKPSPPPGLTPEKRIIADQSSIPSLTKTNSEIDEYYRTHNIRETYPTGVVVNAPGPVIVYVLHALIIGFDKDNKVIYAETYKNPNQNPDKPKAPDSKPAADKDKPVDIEDKKFSASRGPGIAPGDAVDDMKGFDNKSITAENIENYVRHYYPKSPMLEENGGKPGVGQSFIDTGNKYGVNPAFLVATAEQESRYGQQGWLTEELKARGSQNPFGFGVGDRTYPSMTLKVHLDEKYSPIYRTGDDGRNYLVSEEVNWQSWFSDWKSAIQTTAWQIADLKQHNITIEKVRNAYDIPGKEAESSPKTTVEIMNNLYSFTADEYVNKANAAQNKGDFKAAAALARSALRLDPNCPEAWTALAKALIETDSENKDAIKEFVDCVDATSNDSVGGYIVYFGVLSGFKRGFNSTGDIEILKNELNKVTDPKLRALYEKLLREMESAIKPSKPAPAPAPAASEPPGEAEECEE